MLALYLKIFGVGLQDTFVYRWNFLLRSFVGVIPLLATVLVWQSVCEASGKVQDYSLSSMVLYFVGVLLVENLAAPTEDEWRIAGEIREGQISALIVKPLNHLKYRLTLFVSYRVLYCLVTLPVVGLILWVLREHLVWPTKPLTWLYFAFSVTGSALIQFFIAYAMAMFAFWILEVSTLIFILYSFEYFFSGHVFPIDLLSPKIQAVLAWTPFPYELFFPVQILLERISGTEMLRGFAMQGAWVVVTAAFANVMWRLGVRRYQAVGG